MSGVGNTSPATPASPNAKLPASSTTLRAHMPRMEPMAVAFFWLTALALISAGLVDSPGLGQPWQGFAFAGAAGLIVLPFTTQAGLRAATVGLVAGIIIGRIFVLAFVVDAFLTGALVWSAHLYGLVLIVARDQDRPFATKLPHRE
jgi:hypothetical protein